MTNIIRLGDEEWPVKEATIRASIMPRNVADIHWGPATGGIAWSMEILAESHQNESELTAPRMYAQNILANVTSWRQLENKDYFWPNPMENDDPFSYDRPMIYLYHHFDICNCKVHFGHRIGNRFEFEMFGEEDFSGPKLHIQTLITFSGTSVSVGQPEKNDHGINPKAAWERLGELLERNHFSPMPISTIGGWGAWYRFEPIA